jgi:RNA polymerase-associated protein
VFGQPFFLSDEFSLVDCYLAPLLWRLPTLGVEFSGPGAKELKGYMTRVFERDSFLASLTEPNVKCVSAEANDCGNVTTYPTPSVSAARLL